VRGMPKPASKLTVLTLSATLLIALNACGGGSSKSTASPEASSNTTSAPNATATAARAKQDSQIRFLETRAAGDPLDVFSLNSLALQHIQRARETGDVAELGLAGEALKRSVEIRKDDNYEGVALLAGLSVTKHDFAAGLALAQQAIPQKPKEAYAYGALGDAYMGLGRYDEADAAYEKMVTIEPDLPAFGRRALLFQTRGNIDEAEKSWKDAIKRAEGDGVAEHAAWANAQLANLYFTVGRLDDARSHYETSLSIFPTYVHAFAGIARVAGASGDLPKAIEYYTKAINTVPLPEYVTALGDVYAASGDAKNAQAQYDLIAAIEQLYNANGINLDLQIALFNADHGRDVAATVSRAKNAFAEQPSVQAADVLAWVQYKAGNFADARIAIEQALRTGSHDPLILFHAGMIYRDAGDKATAKDYLTRLESQAPNFSVLYARVAKDALAGL
jgi:tetratricopeptide (TPR) repeat protein